MLARQWQFGEFVAEDAGTPLSVEIGISASSASSSLFSGDDSETLSATIEHDPPPAPDRLSRARAGRELLAALRAAGFADVADAMLSEVRWSAPDTPEKAWAAVGAVLAPLVDAEAVRDRLAGRTDGPLPGAHRPEVRAVVESWLRGYDAKHHPGESFAWSGPRLEYRYTLSAPSPEGEVHLHATEADDGTPRWWSVDTSSSLGGRPPAPSSHRSLATPLRYPGMPADRLWEFEDTQVNLGALEVQPHDLARLLVVECAMVYGCDWLNIAIDVPAGALIQITSVRYRNTFGDTISVSHRPTPWQMYTMSPLPGQPPTAGLLASPVGGTRLEGPAVEEVLFLRDEAANLVWGVERTVPDELGRPMPRTAATPGPPTPW